jgi:hypothetical protein
MSARRRNRAVGPCGKHALVLTGCSRILRLTRAIVLNVVEGRVEPTAPGFVGGY